MAEYLAGAVAADQPTWDALAHTGRRAIVQQLGSGPATSTELAELLGIGLPALHKHLALLRDGRLIASIKTGRVVHHRLDPVGLDAAADWLAVRRSFWSNQLDTLGDYLEDR